MARFGFAIEHMLGHITHYQNLKYWSAQDTTIDSVWMPILPDVKDLWGQLPIARNNWSLQSSLRTRSEIQRALRQQPLDALFLHTQTLALFAIPFMRQIPTIISSDATPLNYDSVGAGYSHKVDGNPLLERQKFLWTQKTYQNAACIVTWCEWAKASVVLDYGIAAERVVVIPPGIDLTQWQVKSVSAIADSEKLVRLLFVGGDFVRKGGSHLVEAFRQGVGPCHLDIVTKDPQVQRDLAGVERITVHCGLNSTSPELKALYANADVFVFPTQADCYPLAIVEAMAAGLPIVTTNVGAISEQMRDGINGVLVPTSDVSALVTALRKLVEDDSKRRAMAIASRQLAEQQFDGRCNYGKILTLMKQLTAAQTQEKSLVSPSIYS